MSAAGLVSPEAQLATTPMLIAFLNGMVSLVRDGLSSCRNGFGFARKEQHSDKRSCSSLANRRATADGNLTFAPESSVPSEVVDELGLLLTAGRLSSHSKALMVQAYAAEEAGGGEPLTLLESLLLAAPEFHATNHLAPTAEARQEAAAVASQDRPYKAIVVLFLNGGADTYNLIVPHSNCAASDLYAEYGAVRGPAIALAKETLLPFNVSAGSQPCSTFGLHPELPVLHDLYHSGEACFVANVGALVQPVTKATWKKATEMPNSLFAHNAQQACVPPYCHRRVHTAYPNPNPNPNPEQVCAQNVHAQSLTANGVLGRIAEALTTRDADPYSVGVYSVNGNQKILENSAVVPNIVSKASTSAGASTVPEFAFFNELGGQFINITARKAGSVFGETIAQALSQSLVKNRELAAKLDAANVTEDFLSSAGAANDLGRQLVQVTKVINAHVALGAERDVFFVQVAGFDTHSDEGDKLKANFQQINSALEAFVAEMRRHGIWEQVMIYSE